MEVEMISSIKELAITDTHSKLRGIPDGICVLKSDDHVGVISSARFARSGLAFILAAELRGILPEIINIVTVPLFIATQLLRRVGIHLLYLGWRLSGGVGNFLKELQQDTLWKALELENPHIIQLDQSRTYWIREPQWFREVDNVKYANLGEYVDLFQTKSDGIYGINGRIVAAHVTFNWLFTINPRKVRFGCHSKYTLPKALFVGKRFGGDLRCGGGLKSFFPPFFRALLEYIRFWRVVNMQRFSAYVRNSEYGNCVTYVDPKSGSMSEVFLDIFFGDQKVIDRYLRNRQETTALPLPIHALII